MTLEAVPSTKRERTGALRYRIDDPKTGWKGKGVWTTWSTRTSFHAETGKGTMAKVVHFQIPQDPLAD